MALTSFFRSDPVSTFKPRTVSSDLDRTVTLAWSSNGRHTIHHLIICRPFLRQKMISAALDLTIFISLVEKLAIELLATCISLHTRHLPSKSSRASD
ncbi:hypothetical protein NPIL_190081 [Nephila pilipes]|uniref:Uncharacterized protein n=1 Tax=Nephila pilipes TaxID=299642 RepID=A0A8X6QYK7_NEPPI|nr:hypothetical protein NPIL_190081 [Nephila pilipes]